MKKNRTLSRVVMGASVTAMTVGLAMSFSLEAEASGGGGGNDLEFVPTKCIVEENGITYVLGESNDCKPGDSYCADNDCSRFR